MIFHDKFDRANALHFQGFLSTCKKNLTKRKLLKQFKKYSMFLPKITESTSFIHYIFLIFCSQIFNIFFLKGKINPHFPFKNNFKLHSSKQWPLQCLWWQNQTDLTKIPKMQEQKVPYISNFSSLQIRNLIFNFLCYFSLSFSLIHKHSHLN